jgi:hypothetical protein
MFGQKCKVKASYGKALEDNVFKGQAIKLTHVRAMHDMVKQVTSIFVMVRHVMIMFVRIMHVLVWNIGEMNVWAEMSGQCINGQGT